MKILVTGAGGFIGHHLVTSLREKGHFVRGVDLKSPEFCATRANEFWHFDLRDLHKCLEATRGMDQVYALAADMGGMGFLSQHQASTLRNNAQIDLNTLEAARLENCRRLVYSSSACVYPESLQRGAEVVGLREEDALPADPPDAYGWGKLTAEQLCRYYRQDYGLETRVARFHNIFGPLGAWDGGREKAPAALCRKVALAQVQGHNTVEVWGDGEQTRSFCYVDDCVKGLQLLMDSDYHEPLNFGQDRLVTINQLVHMVAEVAGVAVQIRHIEGPQGVRGRNSDNRRTQSVLGWSPQISLEEGIGHTYPWVREQVLARYGATVK